MPPLKYRTQPILLGDGITRCTTVGNALKLNVPRGEMEAWLPLFNIFLNSPTPESEASQWMQQSFNTTSTTTANTSTSSFISLLSKPVDVAIINSPSSPPSTSPPPHLTKRIMWIQSLPNAVQTRILSFLRVDNKRFCKRELCSLANTILKENKEIDFWVKKAAHNLLDVVSESTSFDWVSSLSLDCSEVDTIEEEFEALPTWLLSLNNNNTTQCPIFPWLPISYDELKSSNFNDSFVDENSPVEGKDGESIDMEIDTGRVYVEHVNAPLDGETLRKVGSLKGQMSAFGLASKGVDIANGICELCFGGSDPLEVFTLIELWEADDETASVLLSHLSNMRVEDVLWQCQVLCSIVLPKMLVLSEPASRVLVTATIEFCKQHQKASVDALLFPLILRKEGINNHICDVVARIIRECLHPAHVSSFCQMLLSGEQGRRKLFCLSCHQCLLSDELVWTEALFTLFQIILNHNVYLTGDSVERLAIMIQQLGDRYSKSLKFANFLLSLVTKCEPSLKSHKILITKAVEQTNTFMTKSILSKLYCW